MRSFFRSGPTALPNWMVLFGLGILIGGANNISFIGSQSYFLSVLQPIDALVTTTIAGIVFALFLRFFHLRSLKFSVFATWVGWIFCFFIFLLVIFHFSDSFRTVAWYFLTLFGMGLFRWILSELAFRHLDPMRARAFFSYFGISNELGILVSIFFLKIKPEGFSALRMMEISAGLYLLFVIGVALQFFPKKNIEKTFTKKHAFAPDTRKKIFKAFQGSLIFLCIGFGVINVAGEHLIKVVLKEHSVSFEAIRNVTTNYRLIGSLLLLSLGSLVGREIKKRHLSPILLLLVDGAVLLGATLYCGGTQYFSSFLFLEITRRFVEQTLYHPSQHMVSSFFESGFRNKIQSLQNFYYYTLVGFPLVFLFTYTPRLGVEGQRQFILGLLFLTAILSLYAVLRLKRRLVSTLEEFLKQGDKTASILAVQGLSLLRPPKVFEEMKDLLLLSPKKLLRKNLILALGHSGQDSNVETLVRQFDSGDEEIQLSVLEALRLANTHGSVRFIANILLARVQPKSLRVRVHAAAIIAGLYGKKAIPFLLNSLDDPDPRIVANTLETLSLFEDKSLRPCFERFLDSPHPRVQANALMGLAHFSRSRAFYRDKIRTILHEKDEGKLASVLYVIGQFQDRHFTRELNGLYDSEFRMSERVAPSLTWALIKTGNKKGWKMIAELLENPLSDEMRQVLLHFFSQFPSQLRFDLVEEMVYAKKKAPEFVQRLGYALRHSPLDFHEELEYLHLIAESPL